MFTSKQTPNRAARTEPVMIGDEAVLRATAIFSLLAIGAIHSLQIVATFDAAPLLGVAFVALVAATVFVAAGFLTPPDSRMWVRAALLGLGAILGYVFTRTVSSPLDNQDVGNWSEMLGLAALFIEGAVVALGVYGLVRAAEPSAAIESPRMLERDVADPGNTTAA